MADTTKQDTRSALGKSWDSLVHLVEHPVDEISAEWAEGKQEAHAVGAKVDGAKAAFAKAHSAIASTVHEVEAIPSEIRHGVDSAFAKASALKKEVTDTAHGLQAGLENVEHKVGDTIDGAKSLFSGNLFKEAIAFFSVLFADIFGNGHFKDFARDMNQEMQKMASGPAPQSLQAQPAAPGIK